jgi:stringent starvation protein A
MTLFTRGDDPHSHWVRFALAEKALELRLVEADAAHPPEDLIDLNPYHAVPTLVDRDLVVYEARIVCEYLDERYPHPALLPTDPVGRAQTRVALHRIEQDWYSLLPALEGPDRREQQRARRLLRDSVVAAEPLFRARPWFLSDQFSLLDVAVAPMLWRLKRWEIDVPDAAQAVQRYAGRVFARPAFRAGLSAAEREMRT